MLSIQRKLTLQLTSIENEIRDVKAILREKSVTLNQSEINFVTFADFVEKYKLNMPFDDLNDFLDFDNHLKTDKNFQMEFVSTS